jgi:hypothetical protein
MAVLDAFSFNNPANNETVRQEVLNMYRVKLAGDYLPFDANYNFFTSEAKSNYSVDITGEIVRLVLDGSADIPTEWTKFIEANRGMWEPLQDGLNEAFAG